MSSKTSENNVALNDSSIEDLKTLPSSYYVDEQVLVQEKERLFFKSWQYACHVSELAEPGAYLDTDILGQNIFMAS